MSQFDPESEGMPAIEDNPPGISGDNDFEGMIPPGDAPVGAEEFGITSREEQLDEPIAERVLREEPDVEYGATGEVGRLVQPDQGMIDADDEAAAIASETGDNLGMSAEEAAMHITETP